MSWNLGSIHLLWIRMGKLMKFIKKMIKFMDVLERLFR